MAQIKKWTPCVIEWDDAVTFSEAAHSDDQFPVASRKSIGFLIRRDKDGVVICMEDDRNADMGDNDCQTITRLPRKMIRSITPLLPGPPIKSRERKKKIVGDAIEESDSGRPSD